jgi:maltose O-acetyltransferase
MKVSEYLAIEKTTLGSWLRNLLINLLPDFWIINNLARPAIARMCGIKCGSKVVLQKGIFYGNPRNLQLGDRVFICRKAFLDGYEKIIIGNDVAVAFGATIITSTHEMGPQEKRTGKLFGSPVVIGSGSWIGARVTIAPGVEIGAGSIVSAGSAVMYSVPANSLVTGVPAKVVAQLEIAPSPGQRHDMIAAAEKPVVQESVAPTVAEPVAEAQDGTMTKAHFYSELEFLLEVRPGSIKGTESLGDLPWNSMTILTFIAMADSELHEVASPPTLAACRTVADLVNLFPGKIV